MGQALPRRAGTLARISHQLSAATADTSAQTALRSVGLLDVLSKYACGGLGRAPCLERRLRRFATTTGEKCGLAVQHVVAV